LVQTFLRGVPCVFRAPSPLRMNTTSSETPPSFPIPLLASEPAGSAQAVALRFMAATGVLFIMMSILSIAALVWSLTFGYKYAIQTFSAPLAESAKAISSDERTIALLTSYIPAGILFIAATFCAVFGYILLRAAGAATREVIPRDDAQLLNKILIEKNQEGVDNYIKLSGLSGIVGLFTKLGLYGLPLATIVLTIFFSVVGLLQTNGTQMFDLAKLTLGAFIGSFVQRVRGDSASAKPAATP
jgi:hypothetical protein